MRCSFQKGERKSACFARLISFEAPAREENGRVDFKAGRALEAVPPRRQAPASALSVTLPRREDDEEPTAPPVATAAGFVLLSGGLYLPSGSQPSPFLPGRVTFAILKPTHSPGLS